ncbi:VOC family protein [Streptomyces sp. S1D4-11]|nr:VOC family protein [Streptomyces sp. S1D4-11]
MLGGTIEKAATHHFLRIDGAPVFVIQRAPEHVPPQWPDGRSQQMHVDLTVDHLVAADRLALEAGTRRLRPTDEVDPAAAQGSRVYSSPAGHPICIRSA